jgi:hypothetical protein
VLRARNAFDQILDPVLRASVGPPAIYQDSGDLAWKRFKRAYWTAKKKPGAKLRQTTTEEYGTSYETIRKHLLKIGLDWRRSRARGGGRAIGPGLVVLGRAWSH